MRAFIFHTNFVHPKYRRRQRNMGFAAIKLYQSVRSKTAEFVKLTINILLCWPGARQRPPNKQIYVSRYWLTVSQASVSKARGTTATGEVFYAFRAETLYARDRGYCNLQTRPLVREGATKLQTRNCLKEISRRKKNWLQVPDGRLTPGQTGRLTVGCKLTNYLSQCRVEAG
jgi:hypothetical protein